MKKKLILIGVAAVLVAICVLCILSNVGKTDVNMNMIGTFVYADGTTEPVNFTIDGYIKEREDGDYDLYLDITPPADFRYEFGSYVQKGPSLVSINQRSNYLPHLLICPSLAYDKQLDNFSNSDFAIDLQKKCAIMLFGNSPDCYLVASQDGEQAHEQLLTYFADYIESNRPSE